MEGLFCFCKIIHFTLYWGFNLSRGGYCPDDGTLTIHKDGPRVDAWLNGKRSARIYC